MPLAAAASLVLIGVVGVGAASAAPAPRLAPTTEWIFGTATPKVNGLRIRSGPSTHHTTYGLLYRGDHMTPIRESWNQAWFQVRLTRRSASGLRSGFTGWVYAAYLRPA